MSRWIGLAAALSAVVIGCSGTPEEEYRRCLREAAGKQGGPISTADTLVTTRNFCAESTGFNPGNLLGALMPLFGMPELSLLAGEVRLRAWDISFESERRIDREEMDRMLGCPEPQPGP